MTDAVLDIQALGVKLSRHGRTNRVLDGISLTVKAGEIIALVGESGSGKSTIGLTLQGLLPQDSNPDIEGSVRVDGVEMVGADPKTMRGVRRNLVRAISQDPMTALNPTMTIRRQMRETAADNVSIIDWLARTGLADPERIADSLPHRLSGGQRQRVMIAMAMLARPKLLIADEPTTALDVTIQAQILDMLRDLAREINTATLFITHDLSVAASLADRVMVLYGGRVAEIGPIRDVLAAPTHPYTAGLLSTRFDFRSDRNRPLPTLPRETANAATNFSSCSYVNRCPIAQPPCHAERPPLNAVAGADGASACFFPEKASELTARVVERAPWPTANVGATGVALELFDISKSFATGPRNAWGRRAPVPILKSVTLRIRPGECVALVGESGSGKSTILRIAAGLLSPDGGDVSRIDGIPPQVVFQDAVASLTPWLTIGEQIGDRLRASGLSREKRRLKVARSLELVGLDAALADAVPSELSGGQCQRAVVARALVLPPKLLLCDEPISAMDVSLAATTLNLLASLRRSMDMAMLFVTHDLAAARIIADRIAVLEKGVLVEDGDPDELIAAPKQPYTRALIAAMPKLEAKETGA
jgi:peptide/nickel transport system ATP-binding protein